MYYIYNCVRHLMDMFASLCRELDARRDWGHAQDYVRAMWLLLQNDHAQDYVIASNKTRTVREFAQTAFGYAGIDIDWEGEGIREVGRNRASGRIVIKVNEEFFRPAEVEVFWGNPAKAELEPGWKRMISFEQLVERMVKNDMELVEKEMQMGKFS